MKIAVPIQHPANLKEPNQSVKKAEKTSVYLLETVCFDSKYDLVLKGLLVCKALGLNIVSSLNCPFSSVVYNTVHMYLYRAVMEICGTITGQHKVIFNLIEHIELIVSKKNCLAFVRCQARPCSS